MTPHTDESAPLRICIVEDNPGLRESITQFIADTPGFECPGAFPSGEEALQGIPKLQPAIVLMDINLPCMNGIECVRLLKAKLPEVQVMMLTVYENSDQIFEALAAGASGYMLKSTSPEELLDAIKDLKNGGSPMSSHIARKVVQAFQPAPRKQALVEQLAPREEQVLKLLSKGLPYKLIASEMDLKIGTIRTYILRIYEKLHVNCRTDAVVKYLDTQPNRPNV